jgi:hypothetical protein
LWSKISAEGLLREDLLHPLPDLFFVHSGSIAPPSCVCKLSGLALDHMRGPEPLLRGPPTLPGGGPQKATERRWWGRVFGD